MGDYIYRISNPVVNANVEDIGIVPIGVATYYTKPYHSIWDTAVLAYKPYSHWVQSEKDILKGYKIFLAHSAKRSGSRYVVVNYGYEKNKNFKIGIGMDVLDLGAENTWIWDYRFDIPSKKIIGLTN